MSNQAYTKNCMFCKQEIRMDQINGKWGAYSINGGFHQCKKVEREEPIVMENQGPKTQPVSIEERLVRLERIVLDPQK